MTGTLNSETRKVDQYIYNVCAWRNIVFTVRDEIERLPMSTPSQAGAHHWFTVLFSVQGILQNAAFQFICDYVIRLRVVSAALRAVLEDNVDISINIRISSAGIKKMRRNFLLRWKGTLNLYCEPEWQQNAPWFLELMQALKHDKPPIINLLRITLRSCSLQTLASCLAPDLSVIRRLHLVFRGPARDFLSSSAPLQTIGRAIPAVHVDLSLAGRDNSGRRACSCLQILRDAEIELIALSLRSRVRPNLEPALLRPAETGAGMRVPACTQR
jgi:hypothetical protein